MTAKNTSLIVLVALLAGAYVYFFTDWFTPPIIQIVPQIRPARALRGNSAVELVSFTMNRDYRLTSVKVVPVSALKTNKNPIALWYLISASNSLPIRGFFYGMKIAGMKPFLTNSRPQKLQPNTPYRLLVEAGRAEGKVDFQTRAAVDSGN